MSYPCTHSTCEQKNQWMFLFLSLYIYFWEFNDFIVKLCSFQKKFPGFSEEFFLHNKSALTMIVRHFKLKYIIIIFIIGCA